MELNILKEVLACLPDERTLFWYFKDRYATYLLQKELEKKSQTIAQLKRGPFGKLVARPICQSVVSHAGGRLLKAEEFAALWPSESIPYVLTTGRWGGRRSFYWQQTSRPGWNLVLQMNFSNEHDEHYRRSLSTDFDHFKVFCHPIHRGKRNTLSWARIDLDFSEGVALIEEIQTDWIREAKEAYQDATKAHRAKQKTFRLWCEEFAVSGMVQYYEQVMAPHCKYWAEAILTATIGFLRDELGFRTIYCHQYETGRALKHIGEHGPPRSLYTGLPKKFCFRKTSQGPKFITSDKKVRRLWKKLKNPSWFVLDL